MEMKKINVTKMELNYRVIIKHYQSAKHWGETIKPRVKAKHETIVSLLVLFLGNMLLRVCKEIPSYQIQLYVV